MIISSSSFFHSFIHSFIHSDLLILAVDLIQVRQVVLTRTVPICLVREMRERMTCSLLAARQPSQLRRRPSKTGILARRLYGGIHYVCVCVRVCDTGRRSQLVQCPCLAVSICLRNLLLKMIQCPVKTQNQNLQFPSLPSLNPLTLQCHQAEHRPRSPLEESCLTRRMMRTYSVPISRDLPPRN